MSLWCHRDTSLETLILTKLVDWNIEVHIKSCIPCNSAKPTNHKLGRYTPLLVPTNPWECINMDFFSSLLMMNHQNLVFVVVDHFKKKIHYGCMKEGYWCTWYCQIILQSYVDYTMVPTTIVSNYNLRFFNNLTLWEMLDT